MAGFIYIFSNPSFDGRLKIGISLNDPSTEKLNKFNQLEVLPEPFAVEYYCFVEQHQNLMRDLEKEYNDTYVAKFKETLEEQFGYSLEEFEREAASEDTFGVGANPAGAGISGGG